MNTSNEIRNLNILNKNNSIENSKVPKFIMMVGLPASGKSSLAKELAKEYEANVHASDEIRKEFEITDYSTESNQKVFAILHNRVKEDLRNGKNVIYDSTSINYKQRLSFLRELKNISCKRICCFMATPYEVCIKRNLRRKEKVPFEVIERMYKNITVPAYFEGWDNIHIIWDDLGDTSKDLSKFQKLWKRMWQFDQRNSHHTLTLGEHCQKASDFFIIENERLYYAALLHDCGKLETASYKNSKGEITDELHYFNHQNVSAYKALFYIRKYFSNEDILYICQLIRWHMQPYFNDKGDKEKLDNKYKKLLGEEFWDDVMKLHKADVAAH